MPLPKLTDIKEQTLLSAKIFLAKNANRLPLLSSTWVYSV